ncbi:hypothetical protein BOX15_Mlig027243g2 [Macrostomum lignano]|uniref:Uncharacterized protein n=1 Tax=Macrostomum lignano TaxID=282301 RepID=A0A267DGP6_9PLAT|nr:hypothetical protein BOX15_Mlig027243g2 [Macrostomum lignano]
MAPTKERADSATENNDKKFIGFYLSLRPEQGLLDSLIYQFYSKLLDQLRLFDTLKVFLDSDYNAETLTKEKFRPKFTETTNPFVRDPPLEFVMFPGDYMLAFRDGFLMFRILEEALKANGESAEAILEKYETYKATKGEKDAYLRACYWYVCTNFVHKWPIQYQVAFFVDCLLYGEWQVSHPNLIGLHLLAIAWMMGIKAFDRFVPVGLRKCLIMLKPPLAGLKAAQGIKVSIEPPWPTTRQPAKEATQKSK